jgi:hypothetical protein
MSQKNSFWEGIIGTPELRENRVDFVESSRKVSIKGLDSKKVLCALPIENIREHLWALCTSSTLYLVDFDRAKICSEFSIAELGFSDLTQIQLRVSRDARYLAVAGLFELSGCVYNRITGLASMIFERDKYHHDVTPFPFAFFEHEGKQLFIYATAWNKLDVFDPENGQILTSRELSECYPNESYPEHYLDYFHGRLLVSPDQQTVVDDGWVWAPVGRVSAWCQETH